MVHLKPLHITAHCMFGRNGLPCRIKHWHILIYETILGLISSYLWTLRSYCFCCLNLFLPSVLRARTELEKKVACKYVAPFAWNMPSKLLKVKEVGLVEQIQNIVM